MKKIGITLGIGIDVINSSRFQKLLQTKSSTFTSRLCDRILHPIHEIPKFKSFTTERQIQYITGAWASKEALFKTLGPEDQKNYNFNQWYRYHDSYNKPFIWSDHYNVEDEEFHLSLSHDDTLVIATVLRQKVYKI
ncbi:uncharacterized protein KGF55_002394 [Candida pseudojiufengensis]|uniref:uncharacterized protein n=1 Tax=Candida pseudojiufengensis TaxID=497109 RepID=UPI0022251AEF|nr:uncharacterized protein KGF55_002394 [Candida pseudojiufengensis]KAI5963514.1 hypothetical protein KGF55_002394 [Candida pseudojiufengensis]